MNDWHEIHSFKNRSKLSSHTLLILFWISSVIIGLCLFLFGFFPMKAVSGDFSSKQQIPTKLYDFSLDPAILYPRKVGRFVLVVIDAFRWDFLDIPQNMPYVSQLRRSKQATVLTTRCHPPTATMPRLKALMTGSIPNYIDVALNLGSNQVKEDNLVYQATENGLKVVFYGDEVWLDLFPEKFLRKEGTTSFFVSDYTEVDTNVTRNIATEMDRNDWDILILHYLGLDHIGHLAGPRSPLVSPKLREMDAVIERLHLSLQKWDLEHSQEPSYLVVVGDHGMHDLGSHGGASLGEILASLILIESAVHNVSYSGKPEVSQIDFAATMAVLLGLPIPKSNLGVVIPHALGRLTHQQYLFALFYNTHQVADQFLMANPNGKLEDSYAIFLKAQRVHLSWLENKSDDLRRHVESLYFEAAKGMSSYVVKNLVSYDILALVIGSLITLQVLICSIIAMTSEYNERFWKKGRPIFFALASGFVTLLLSALIGGFFGILSSQTEKYGCFLLLAVFNILLLCWNFIGLTKQRFRMNFESLPGPILFLFFGSMLHAISLSASSLIEEEHQTWHFMWVTLISLSFLSISCSKNKDIHLQLALLAVLLSHRILRKLNQTGDKYASLPDIADWLEQPDHKVFLTLLFLSGLFGVWISLQALKCVTTLTDKILCTFALIFVLLYRCSIGEVSSPYAFEPSRGVLQVRMFWVICVLIIIQSIRMFKYHKSLNETIKVPITLWVLLSTLLLRPSNVVLIPYLILSSITLNFVFKKPVERSVAYVWLGNVVYFYQGNSNNLSTIDVVSGYIGADEHQNLMYASLLVLAHTCCFPILATLLQWLGAVSQPDELRRKENLFTSLHMSFLLRLLPLSICCIVMFCNRNHLFIWSVFAPKLIYEGVLSVVAFLLLTVGCILQLTCRF